MEEAAVHARALQIAHGAAVAVGQDGFGAELSGDGFQSRGDFFERFFPGDAREAAFALWSDAALRIQQAVGRVFAFEIASDLAAEKAARDGMLGIATQAAAFAVLDVDQEGSRRRGNRERRRNGGCLRAKRDYNKQVLGARC